jgi:hypothetical protein
MKKDVHSRREFLRSSALFGGAALLPAWLLACGKKELACTDTAGLSEPDVAMRNTLAYVDRSSDPTKVCSGCALYKPGPADGCGGCQVLKGPIHPQGGCKSFAAKPA